MAQRLIPGGGFVDDTGVTGQRLIPGTGVVDFGAAVGGTHNVTIANSAQANTASPASVSQTGVTLVTVSNSTQVNTSSTAAIYQAVPGTGTLTIPAVKDWETGLLKTGQTGITVDVRNISTGALVVRKTGQTTHASTGVCVVTDALIVPGTTYEVCTRFADGSKGMWDYTAS